MRPILALLLFPFLLFVACIALTSVSACFLIGLRLRFWLWLWRLSWMILGLGLGLGLGGGFQARAVSSVFVEFP